MKAWEDYSKVGPFKDHFPPKVTFSVENSEGAYM